MCTDLNIPGEKAEAKHKKWHVENRIKYAAIDAIDMPKDYRKSFDYVTFKSVLGGIGSYGNIEKERLAVNNIQNVLRDDGYVVFIENMKASKMHCSLRKMFRKHGNRWHYQSDENIQALFKDFTLIKKGFFGVTGLLGPNETIRRVLGNIDYCFERFIPNRDKYIGVYVYQLNKTKL